MSGDVHVRFSESLGVKFPRATRHIIAADNPIFVTQFMDNRGSFGGDPTGDPAIGNMVPGAQYMNFYTFSTVGGGQFLEHYLTIIAANDDVGSLTLDDVAVDSGDFSAIADSDFSVARIIITDDVHGTASDSGHGIMVMGFNECDSYLYTGGAMFQFINPGGDPWNPVCDCVLQEGPPKVFECTATDNHPKEGDDEDTGIFFVALLDGATNIELDVDEFTPGDGEVTYRVQRTDEEADGTGTVRVTDGAGNTCEYEISFTAVADSATVTTAAVSDITTTTAGGGGNVTANGGAAVTARGVCWSTSENPTTDDDKTEDGSGTGVFTGEITGLDPDTTYHVRAYATNSVGTAYGDDVSFTTNAATVPTVTTADVSEITATAATSGGNVTDDGGAEVTARGVCWSTSENPTTDDDHTSDGTGTGEFTSSITGLNPNTTYYVVAYATNSEGTAYGDDVMFTTAALEPEPEPESETAPDLRVTIESLAQDAYVSDEVAFGVLVENVGDGGATDVLLTIPLPENTEFVSAWRAASQAAQAAPLNAAVEDDEITIEVGDVAPGEEVQIELVLRALVAGKVTVRASATSEETPTPASAQTTAEVDVEDVYWTVVETIAPIHACGVLGIMPAFVLLGLVNLKRRGRTRSGRALWRM